MYVFYHSLDVSCIEYNKRGILKSYLITITYISGKKEKELFMEKANNTMRFLPSTQQLAQLCMPKMVHDDESDAIE